MLTDCIICQFPGNSSGVTFATAFIKCTVLKMHSRKKASKQPETISCQECPWFQMSAHVWTDEQARNDSREVDAVRSMRPTVFSNLQRAHTISSGLVKESQPARIKGNRRYHFQQPQQLVQCRGAVSCLLSGLGQCSPKRRSDRREVNLRGKPHFLCACPHPSMALTVFHSTVFNWCETQDVRTMLAVFFSLLITFITN